MKPAFKLWCRELDQMKKTEAYLDTPDGVYFPEVLGRFVEVGALADRESKENSPHLLEFMTWDKGGMFSICGGKSYLPTLFTNKNVEYDIVLDSYQRWAQNTQRLQQGQEVAYFSLRIILAMIKGFESVLLEKLKAQFKPQIETKQSNLTFHIVPGFGVGIAGRGRREFVTIPTQNGHAFVTSTSILFHNLDPAAWGGPNTPHRLACEMWQELVGYLPDQMITLNVPTGENTHAS